MPKAYLPDRGIVSVAGDDAGSLLQGIVTCDMDRVTPDAAAFGALLTPQGKILFDFIVSAAPDAKGYRLDCQRALAPDLARRLGLYKLRAKAAVEDASEALGVVAGWGEPAPNHAITDPRLADLGWRAIVPRDEAEAHAAPEAYHAHRIALGVPEGGKDFIYGDTFPHEADMDQLGGVDFAKGCYVGQEVVSRMEHRGTARSRIVPVAFPGGIVAIDGLDVTAGGRMLGKLGSCAAGRGLALLRLDRVADAVAAGQSITAGGLELVVETPVFARFAFPGAAAGAKVGA